ncbi:MAG: hypothetical protein COX57_11550 [Alphaproteobacteria bacterium CG_4_10_14_0_2_um_filter_63_37]|nr:MAG: hypothetical protein COX57_11550 [Alphaproteobacteria bacterium CG_4_10_14_0_2_um_filter_63_37]
MECYMVVYFAALVVIFVAYVVFGIRGVRRAWPTVLKGWRGMSDTERFFFNFGLVTFAFSELAKNDPAAGALPFSSILSLLQVLGGGLFVAGVVALMNHLDTARKGDPPAIPPA